jgi:ATP phosphoribosyltransferase regulatory subunit
MFEKNKNFNEKLPSGFRDIFPVEAEERNNIRSSIKQEFELWGYGEIKTPVVEFTKNISEGVGKNWKDKLINFFDFDGSLVSLRTDMTVPIARFTGMRIKKSQLPVRFCYFANSFRRSGLQKGEKREYNQAGLEFIGSDSNLCDVETLLIIVNILNRLVPENFLIGLGDVSITEALYNWFNLNDQGKELIRHNLITKNYVSIREYLFKIDRVKAEIFLRLIKPEKNIKKIISILNEINDTKVTKSFYNLENVYKILIELDINKYFIIDLGILRDFDYYTGLIFEAYSSNINSILGSGGRYDRLIRKFGLDVPATGFALDIDILHKSMKESNIPLFKNKHKLMVYCESGNHIRLLEYSEIVRKENVIVEILFEKIPDIDLFAKEKKFDFTGIIDDKFEMINVTDLKYNRKSIIKIKDSVKYFKNEADN